MTAHMTMIIQLHIAVTYLTMIMGKHTQLPPQAGARTPSNLKG
jgi:hypothetical protein